jgi:hypothetical protein
LKTPPLSQLCPSLLSRPRGWSRINPKSMIWIVGSLFNLYR